jgi:hypothetical protein
MGVAMLFATHQYVTFLVTAHDWKGIDAGDWPTWIGAIGTVLTLVGTIVLATSESRRRKRDAVATARLAAAGMHFQQLHNVGSINLAIGTIDQALNSQMRISVGIEFTQTMIKNAIRHLDTVEPWTTAELLMIVPLPEDCAVHVSGAQGRIKSTLKFLRALQADTDLALIEGHLKLNRGILQNASIMMSRAAQIFENAVNFDAP